MPSVIYKLQKHGLISPPKWLPDNTHYETLMGSIAYGVSGDTSDVDVYGFAIPPKEDVFPHLRGEIYGFGRQVQRFEQYQQHHIVDADVVGGRGREYDLTIYSIVKFFQLVMENNPNMVDSLYTPHDCVLHITKIGQMVRDRRDVFLSKLVFHKFRGYAFSQISKMSGKTEDSKRWEMVQQYGYDLKFAYHSVRLVLECEQVLTEGTLDLRRNADMLKAIRAGEWAERQVRDWFTQKEMLLQPLYTASELPYKPNEKAIKELLLECLEEHYGSLEQCVTLPVVGSAIDDIIGVLQKHKLV
jgi:predicted nucleotidyltransferase